MRDSVRQTFLAVVLLMIFAASLGVAQVIIKYRNGHVAQHNSTLAWHLTYPSNFRPRDLSRVLLPIKPTDAMVEELPDHSLRYLYIFRAQTNESLADASEELFEQFNHTPPTARAEVQMAGQIASELSFIAPQGFVVQRAALIQNSLFAVTLVGGSELTGGDIDTFNKICDSVSVHQEPVK